MSSIGGSVSDPSILTGMRGAENSVDLRTIRHFTDRLETAYEGGVHGNYGYGAETYDAVVITALAAEVAGSTDPTVIAGEINDVTRTGTKCRSFVQCRDLIAEGGNPDYVGIGGDLRLRGCRRAVDGQLPHPSPTAGAPVPTRPSMNTSPTGAN